MKRKSEPKLLLTTSPFLKHPEDTRFIMWQVNYTLIPVLLTATYFFGISAILVSAASVMGALLPEWWYNRAKHLQLNTLKDGSAMITGLLLALTLPPGIPLWMAFLGGFIAISLGKLLFGGIGYNIFNPALVGRAFLQAAFPVAMTTWVPYSSLGNFFQIRGANLTLPFLKSDISFVTTATPLAQMKFESQMTPLSKLLLGSTAGSLGETCSLVILLMGVYLAARKIINWRIPLSIFVTVYIFAAVLYWVNPARFPVPTFHLLSGGLVLGAVFMATDLVTSPITQRGCWIFGVGIGIMVMVIRVFGGLPEGVMYSILFMNAVVPLLNQVTQPRIYGERKTK